MRRIQRAAGHAGEEQFRIWQRRERKESVRKLTATAVFLVLVGLVGPVIPEYGRWMWILGWGVCLTLFVASIMMMAKDAPIRGLLVLFLAIIVLPVWIAVAPFAVMNANELHTWRQALKELQKQNNAAQNRSLLADVEGASREVNEFPPAPSAPVREGLETITSKDGRMIRGTIVSYDASGVRMKRVDGLVVSVAFDLMSAGDVQKFRDRYASGLR